MTFPVSTEEIPLAPPVPGHPAVEATFVDELERAREPQWLAERRLAAWARCNRGGTIAEQGVAIPSKDERWRFASHRAWNWRGAVRVQPRPGEILPDMLQGDSGPLPTTASLVFVDDAEISRAPLPAELARRGVIFLPLAEAIARHPDLLREHLFQHDHALGGDKFLAFHQAYARSGAFLYVPDNVEIPETFSTVHWAAAPGAALFPHTLIVAGANSKVTFLDYYGSAPGAGEAWLAGAATVLAGPGAQVFRKSIQHLSPTAHAYQADTTVCGRDANVKNIAVHLGGRRSRYECHSRLEGAGAHLELLALTIATGSQEFDQRTFQHHAAPRATSNLLYKNALLDEARTIFAGMIRVDPLAEETDAYQQNRNLLLNAAAEADSLPGLEILNQNVRCTHGATTSRLDPEELFYMRTRGLSHAVACQLLVFGFFEEIIQKVDNAPLAELLRRLAREKFAK